jgi:hypothetical protein
LQRVGAGSIKALQCRLRRLIMRESPSAIDIGLIIA